MNKEETAKSENTTKLTLTDTICGEREGMQREALLGLDFFGHFLSQVFHPAPAGTKSDKTLENNGAK